jgi:hypothetical protein
MNFWSSGGVGSNIYNWDQGLALMTASMALATKWRFIHAGDDR